MKLLAIDTSSNACSVAIRVAGQTVEDHTVEPRAHTSILMPMIRRLLQEAAVRMTDLDAVVLGNGPGSFIGMRIGASVAQGLCHAAGLRIIPVSSLAAVAAEAMDKYGAERVLVAQDAHMNEVYLGSFTRDGTSLPIAEAEEIICAVGPLAAYKGQYTAAGDGWNRYPELQAANTERVSKTLPVSFPHASYLLDIAATVADQALDPVDLAPAYLRTKVVEKPAGKR